MQDLEPLNTSQIQELLGSQTILVHQLQLLIHKLTKENEILREAAMSLQQEEEKEHSSAEAGSIPL
jgi:hypothetical protein